MTIALTVVYDRGLLISSHLPVEWPVDVEVDRTGTGKEGLGVRLSHLYSLDYDILAAVGKLDAPPNVLALSSSAKSVIVPRPCRVSNCHLAR